MANRKTQQNTTEIGPMLETKTPGAVQLAERIEQALGHLQTEIGALEDVLAPVTESPVEKAEGFAGVSIGTAATHVQTLNRILDTVHSIKWRVTSLQERVQL